MKTTRSAVAVFVGLALVAALPSLVDAGTVCDATPQPIPFGDIVVSLTVDSPDLIESARVFVGIDHPRVGDLGAWMGKHLSTGTYYHGLFYRPAFETNPPFGCTGDDVSAFFRDDAAVPAQTSCSNQTGLTMGPYQSWMPLSWANIQPVQGEWRLLIDDEEPTVSGQYLTWCLIWDALDLVFADGFESGDTSAWSSVDP